MIEMKESGEPLAETDIADFERDLGYSLPKDYRAFLLNYNGGVPKPDGFSLVYWGGKPEENRVSFYGLGASVHEGDNLRWTQACFTGRIPSELLPIGDDPGGNQICLCVRGEQSGSVYFWDHELEHAPPTYKNTARLATTFSEFVSSLHEIKREWETPVDIAIQKDDLAELEKLLDERADLEARDQFGRTMLENAAIANAIHVFEWMYLRGAKLGNSLGLAEENFRFFPEHERMVKLIRHLMQKQ